MARPLPDPVLFLDECLGTKDVPEALRSEGVRVEVLLDHFDSGCPDEEWLPVVAERLDLPDSSEFTELAILTKDKWIRRRPAQRAALEKAGYAAFVLSAKGLTGEQMGLAFAKAYPRMRKALRDYEPPFVATVHKSGSVKLLTKARRRGGIRRDGTPDPGGAPRP